MGRAALRQGCTAAHGKPKTQYPTREDAQRGLEWMVHKTGAMRSALRVYHCRYSPADDPHFHVGHIPGVARKHYGRR